MLFTGLISLLPLLGLASGGTVGERQSSSCTFAQRKAGVQQEIATIRSHTAADAAKIPLAPTASRTFFITPAELGGKVTLPPVNVGVTADTVRSELVVLATILNAGVPQGSDSYTNNANGSVTVDYIQTDDIVLERVMVREIHSFDLTTCQITKIVGYVRGNVICPTNANNDILQTICKEVLAVNS